ncbi:MAG: M20/M25/M40 family metallo-hydrolase, partial [Candidatus Hodarchaeota archaeon]
LKNISSNFEFTIYPLYESLVARLPRSSGLSELQILVGAHYDTVPNSNGTDDNASGVASVLEIARVLSNYSWPCDLLFTLFNAEENGRLGSQEIAEQFSHDARPTRVFTLDMILWNQETGIRQVLYDDRMNDIKSKFFGLLMQNFSRDFGQTDLTLTPRQDQSRWDLSDHGRFWDLQIPTILVTEENPFANPYYHKPTDIITNTDYDFAGARQVTATLATTISYVALTSTDTDQDGLTFAEENYLNTDPLNNDTDRDGLSDLEEALGATDPLNNDTDGDNILDGEEGFFIFNTQEIIVFLFSGLGFMLVVLFFVGCWIIGRYKKKHS